MVAQARFEDVEQIRDLIGFYAKRGLMLPRSLNYVYEHLREHVVEKKDDLVIGCCALHITWEKMAEIKSLAVDPRYAKKGVGAKLLKHCLKEAENLGIKKVFTLTLEPEFFKKHGFKPTPKEKLPMKIWGECALCNKYPDCDEQALITEIK
ncbi:MAG: N-acetyltransferase [Candidatus Altiarchaeales archaeon]|nr:N-acetyltransferase [Candidatus Altiarchaeales archaeon]